MGILIARCSWLDGVGRKQLLQLIPWTNAIGTFVYCVAVLCIFNGTVHSVYRLINARGTCHLYYLWKD